MCILRGREKNSDGIIESVLIQKNQINTKTEMPNRSLFTL